MKLKTLFVAFVFLTVLLAACGAETANEVDGNTNQGGSLVQDQNSATGGENQAVDQAAEPTMEAQSESSDKAEVSFANDVLPILESRCLNCHGGDRIEGGLVLRSYADLMAGGQDGVVIIPGDAIGSLLYELVSTGEMPKRGANLTPVQLEVLLEWINAGALDN